MKHEPGKWAKLTYDVQLREKVADGKWLVDEFACNEKGEHVACASSIVDEEDLMSVKDISPWAKKDEAEAKKEERERDKAEKAEADAKDDEPHKSQAHSHEHHKKHPHHR